MKTPKLFSQLLGRRWSGYVIGLCVPMMLGAVIVFAGCGGDEKTPEYEKGECDEGYVWSSNGCVDIDECATGTHDCAVAAICTNTPGSFSCACREGGWAMARPAKTWMSVLMARPHATGKPTARTPKGHMNAPVVKAGWRWQDLRRRG